jgi:hypothetical protein
MPQSNVLTGILASALGEILRKPSYCLIAASLFRAAAD